jgi:H+/Cl- antiporter ClcA
VLPLDRPWYRKLLGYALVLGLAGGALAVVYMGVTGAGSDLFFGDAGTDWWTGEWWWIPLIALGGLIVAWLCQLLSVPDEVPGSIAYAQQAWVDPASAPRLVAVSVVSLISGASLGPSFGLVVMGGGLGSWVASRFLADEETDEAKQEYTLTGMTGPLGGAFSAPVFGAVLASELSPTSKRQYVTAFIPQLTAASLGYVVFFGVTGGFDAQ